VFETNGTKLKKVLILAAAIEVATGLMLIVDPAIVVALLLGPNGLDERASLGRFLGIALLALGLAAWPGSRPWATTFRAMMTYNALIASYLAYLGATERQSGLLLWPAAGLHAVVALILVWMWRQDRHIQEDRT
jgi:hypothetical protein